MAYEVNGTINIAWIPDGAGPLTVPSQQSINIGTNPAFGPILGAIQGVVVPGADAPTQANILAAISTLATNLGATLTAAQIATIQGWASGGN